MEQKIFEELLRCIPEEASMNLAEGILNVCLEAGMEPPRRKSTSIFDGGDEWGMTNEWED